MAGTSSDKKDIEQYKHKDKTRCNNPQVGIADAEIDSEDKKQLYEYDPHLDPQLWWAGKMAHMKFKVPTVSLQAYGRYRMLESVVLPIQAML